MIYQHDISSLYLLQKNFTLTGIQVLITSFLLEPDSHDINASDEETILNVKLM